MAKACKECNGSGTKWVTTERVSRFSVTARASKEKCPRCKGTGEEPNR